MSSREKIQSICRATASITRTTSAIGSTRRRSSRCSSTGPLDIVHDDFVVDDEASASMASTQVQRGIEKSGSRCDKQTEMTVTHHFVASPSLSSTVPKRCLKNLSGELRKSRVI